MLYLQAASGARSAVQYHGPVGKGYDGGWGGGTKCLFLFVLGRKWGEKNRWQRLGQGRRAMKGRRTGDEPAPDHQGEHRRKPKYRTIIKNKGKL